MIIYHSRPIIMSPEDVELAGHRAIHRIAEAKKLGKNHVKGFNKDREYDYNFGNIIAGMALCKLCGLSYRFDTNLNWRENEPLFTYGKDERTVLVRTAPVSTEKDKSIHQHQLPFYKWELKSTKVQEEIRALMVGLKEFWFPCGWLITKDALQLGTPTDLHSGRGMLVHISKLNTITKDGKFRSRDYENEEDEKWWKELDAEIKDAINYPYKLLLNDKLMAKFKEMFE